MRRDIIGIMALVIFTLVLLIAYAVSTVPPAVSTVPPQGYLSSFSDHIICTEALTEDKTNWDTSPTFANQVAEASRRRLSLAYCSELASHRATEEKPLSRPCTPEDLKEGDGFANCEEYWAAVERANRPCSPEDLKKGDGFANCGEYWAAVERADNVTGTLKAKEQAQREELAKRAAAEEEARERWRQAQANTYTWSSWSYSYDYSYTYYPQSYYYYYYVPRRHR
jgi:hypothetical protein